MHIYIYIHTYTHKHTQRASGARGAGRLLRQLLLRDGDLGYVCLCVYHYVY